MRWRPKSAILAALAGLLAFLAAAGAAQAEERAQRGEDGGFLAPFLQQLLGIEASKTENSGNAQPAAAPKGPAATAPPSGKPPLPESAKSRAFSLDVAIGPLEPRDPTPATDCDRLATHNWQWEKAPGVTGHPGNVTTYTLPAETACRAALKQYPDSRRLMFLLSKTVARKYDEKLRLIVESVKRGSLDAAAELGQACRTGIGAAPRDFRQAIRWFEEAGQRGYGRGYHEIGVLYSSYGKTERLKTAEARHWYEKAAGLGYGPALSTLGYAYQTGTLGVAKDPAEAGRLYRRALAAGHVGTYKRLGDMAKTETERSPAGAAKAREWYLKGVEAGDPNAATSMALLYKSNDEERGIKKNLAEAKKWYERAVSLGYVYALLQLAQIEVRKDNPNRSETRALALLDRLRTYVPAAHWTYQYLYNSPDSYVFDPAKAFNRLLKAAEADGAVETTMRQLAQAYEKGTGVTKNLDLARHWYERIAAENEYGTWDLARFYMEGLGGLPKDTAKAGELMLVSLAGRNYYPSRELIDKKGTDLDPAVILAVQRKLKALGYETVAPSGIVDPATHAALKEVFDPFRTSFTREKIVAAR